MWKQIGWRIVIIQLLVKMAHSLEKYNDDPMPELVPLERKNSPGRSRKESEEQLRSKAEDNKASEAQSPTARDNSVSKAPDLDRVASKKMDENIKRRQTEMKKRNEISKNLISEMINKISLKSIAEENYPVSNETIERLLLDLEEEIAVLSQEVAKFENSLALNPTNQHIKKELQAVEKSLNQLKTIRELYQEKIDNRGKISELEAKIMNLKNENRDLKIKIARGIEKIESHIHNLPCEKEKELIEEVNKYKQALNREKDMRLNLETNISTIVLNFKRFYVEADDARKIVTEQLRAINQKEQVLNTKLDNLNLQKFEPRSQELKSIRLGSNANSSEAFFRDRRLTNRITDEENMAEIINQINQKDREKEREKEKEKERDVPRLDRIEDARRTREKQNVSQLGSTILNRQVSETSRNPFLLDEQIEKMRVNQHNFKKITQRRH